MAFAWYRRGQWDRLRACSTDRAELEETYDEWVQSVKKTERILKAQGVIIRRVDVDVDRLVAWAALKSLEVNAETRAEYASLLAQELT